MLVSWFIHIFPIFGSWSRMCWLELNFSCQCQRSSLLSSYCFHFPRSLEFSLSRMTVRIVYGDFYGPSLEVHIPSAALHRLWLRLLSTLNWKRNWEMEYSCELPGRRIDMGLSACQLVIPTLLTAVIFQGISWAFISQDFYICKLSLPSLNAFSICLYFCLYLMHFILLVVLLVYHLSC